jgi:hypothetical protein
LVWIGLLNSIGKSRNKYFVDIEDVLKTLKGAKTMTLLSTVVTVKYKVKSLKQRLNFKILDFVCQF